MHTVKVAGISRLLAILSLLLLIAGCSGGSSGSPGDTGENTPVAQKEAASNISGIWKIHQDSTTKAICDGTGEMTDYVVVITQNGDSLMVTDPDGNQFAGVVNGDSVSWSGSYTKENGTMTISSMVLSLSQGSRTLTGTSAWEWSGDGISCSGTTNVTATKIYDTVSGKVTVNGSALQGVTITISGIGSVVTNENGTYTTAVLSGGDYTLTPLLAGFTFTPAVRTLTIDNGGLSGVDFEATADTSAGYSIYGKIAGADGTPLQGVTVSLNDGAGQTQTDAAGNFSLGGLTAGTYTVSPSLAGYLFNPGSRQVIVTDTHVPANFITYRMLTQVRYSIIDLGVLEGYDSSSATAINNAGQVVGQLEGYATSNGIRYPRSHAFLYSQGSMSDLGTLAGAADDYPSACNSYASGINDSGQIVGCSHGVNTAKQGILFQGGVMTSLDFSGMACGINDSGQIAGYRISSEEDGSTYAFLLSGGTVTELGSLTDFPYGIATDINSSGQIVGFCGNRSVGMPVRAFLYSNGAMTDLGTLSGDASSTAYGINDNGDIVGASTPDPARQECSAFLLSSGSMADLGMLYPQDISCAAYGININGQAVGSSGGMYSFAWVYRAFLYSDGMMIDLNSLIDYSLGWTLESATGINDSGQIIGFGRIGDGNRHAFLMTPMSP
jgi:probable HAF family extracellular repeat protein